MKPLKMQPTFTMNVHVRADELMPRIRRVIQAPDLSSHVVSAGQCVDLHVDRTEQRFWSPHLNVQVSESESGSQLHCRFSPRPEVWTMFMFFYFVAAFVASAAAIHGYVQWFLGDRPWSLVLIPIALVVIVSLHAASLVGQRLSSDQMDDLRQHLDSTIERALSSDANG